MAYGFNNDKSKADFPDIRVAKKTTNINGHGIKRIEFTPSDFGLNAFDFDKIVFLAIQTNNNRNEWDSQASWRPGNQSGNYPCIEALPESGFPNSIFAVAYNSWESAIDITTVVTILVLE